MTGSAGEPTTVADPMTPRELDALAWRLADGMADTIRDALAEPPALIDLREPKTAEAGQRWH